MNNNEACAAYFKGNPAYRRCFLEFEKKWNSYGRAKGIITLKHTSEEERRAIGGILGKTFYEDAIRFPFAEFEKGLQCTKFAPVNFEEVLEAYFARKMITTQKMRMEEERSRAEFFETVEGCLTECAGPDSVVVFWLREMYSKKKFGYQTVIREYGRDRERTEKLLKTVGRALILLEDIRETEEEYPLAVFSAEISGNPHYFDQGTTAGQLLVHGMCYATRTDYPENAHRWRELLLSNGIVPDNISSIVHIYGLRLQIDSCLLYTSSPLISQILRKSREILYLTPISTVKLRMKKHMLQEECDYPENNALYLMLLSGDPVDVYKRQPIRSRDVEVRFRMR